MTKHFEFLWEEAEVAAQMLSDHDVFTEMRQFLNDLEDVDVQSTADKEENKDELLGELLLRICLITSAKRLNINAYRALQEAINNLKIDALDPDITSE